MTSLEWDAGSAAIWRRQSKTETPWRLVPESVNPKHLVMLSKFMQITNTNTLVEVMLYGAHIVIFGLCCYVLLSRQKRVQWFTLSCAFALFALSTADVAYTIRCATSDLPALFFPMDIDMMDERIRPKPAMFVTNNFIADILLFHRCYVIWGRPKTLLVIALVCLTADTMWGWLMVGFSKTEVRETLQPMYYWSVFALNIAVTAASVGRIYWVTMLASPEVERGTRKIYRTIISAFVESAAVYSLSILAYLVWSKYQPIGYSFVMLSVVARLVAIMPTLMIVQVALLRDSGPFTRAETPSASHVEVGNNPADSVILDTIISIPSGPLNSFGSSWLGQLERLGHDQNHERTFDTIDSKDTKDLPEIEVAVDEKKGSA